MKRTLLLFCGLVGLASSSLSQVTRSVMMDASNNQVNPFGNGSLSNTAFKFANSPNTGFYADSGVLYFARAGNNIWNTDGTQLGLLKPLAFVGTNEAANMQATKAALKLSAPWLELTNLTDARDTLGYWTNNFTFDSINTGRKLFIATDHITSDPEDEADYSVRIRHYGAVNNAKGLLVTTPNTSANDSTIFHAASQSQVATNYVVSRFIVKSRGNVGIGTTHPTYNLHVVGNTRITGNLLMDSPQVIKDHLMNDESWWGEAPSYFWGPRAFLGNTKLRSLHVRYNTTMDGRLSLNNQTWTQSQFNSQVDSFGANDFYAGRFASEKGSRARGVLITMPNAYDDEQSVLLKAMAGIPEYDSVTDTQTNVTTRFVVYANGRVGINTRDDMFIPGDMFLIHGGNIRMPTNSLIAGTAAAQFGSTVNGGGVAIGWHGSSERVTFDGSGLTFLQAGGINFSPMNTNGAAITRTNIGLGGGITTNISVLRPGNITNTLQFNRGILTNVTAP